MDVAKEFKIGLPGRALSVRLRRVALVLLGLTLGGSAVAMGSSAMAGHGVAGTGTQPQSAAVPQAGPPRLNYQVYGSSVALVNELEAGLAMRFHHAGVRITGKFPSATLILLEMQDVDSRVNKSGVTVVIAYVSNSLTVRFALDYMKHHGHRMSPLLLTMIRQDGFLHHLGSAHLDEPSDKEVKILLDTVSHAFLQKMGVLGQDRGGGTRGRHSGKRGSVSGSTRPVGWLGSARTLVVAES